MLVVCTLSAIYDVINIHDLYAERWYCLTDNLRERGREETHTHILYLSLYIYIYIYIYICVLFVCVVCVAVWEKTIAFRIMNHKYKWWTFYRVDRDVSDLFTLIQPMSCQRTRVCVGAYTPYFPQTIQLLASHKNANFLEIITASTSYIKW